MKYKPYICINIITMATMTIEDFKLQPIREQVEYLFDKLDSNSESDMQSLKEIIADKKYKSILKKIQKLNRIPKSELNSDGNKSTTCDDWRNNRINEIVEIFNK